MKNNDCDNDKCRRENGVVRILPTGGDGNVILCYACYLHEIAFRKERNLDLHPDCQFALPEWENLAIYNSQIEPGTIQAKLQTLCDLITSQQRKRYIAEGYRPEIHDHEAHFHMGSKYAKVDVGDSGRYMVDIKTGEIYGTKAYGVIHRGYYFGTLDTINDWNWGDYRAIKTQPQPAIA